MHRHSVSSSLPDGPWSLELLPPVEQLQPRIELGIFQFPSAHGMGPDGYWDRTSRVEVRLELGRWMGRWVLVVGVECEGEALIVNCEV